MTRMFGATQACRQAAPSWRRRGSVGSTLVELLVSIVFLALLTATVQQFARAMLRGVRVLEAASEAQEAARLGVGLIVGDLRDAGYSPHGDLGNGLRRAEVDAIALARDLNGDGDTDDGNERVAYLYARERRTLQRAMGDAPPQPLLGDLALDGLRFTYFSAEGPVTPAAGGLDAGQRALIRRVTAHLAIAIPHPDPSFTIPLRTEQTGVVWLRNG
jgi:type II secretory pathway component PulJ